MRARVASLLVAVPASTAAQTRGCDTEPTCLPCAAATSRLMSCIGLTERTRGITSKLFSGGGELVNHSSVFPSHGSLPDFLPFLALWTMLTSVIRMPSASTNEPIVEIRFQLSQP